MILNYKLIPDMNEEEVKEETESDKREGREKGRS